MQVGGNITVVNAGGGELRNEAASTTNPTVIVRSIDTDTGIGADGGSTNTMHFICGALSCMNMRNVAGARQIGFYDGAAIALQTGVAVTTAAVHAALVNLRLITA